MITTPEVKKIYASLQKQLYYLIPEKWDRIYLYASVGEQINDSEKGEMFFYYFPKGIFKKNPINVYEIPNRFNLSEKEYIGMLENLYDTIKQLRQIYVNARVKVWSNITIKMVGVKFEIEFNYKNLKYSNYSNTERHIIWKYKYLDIPLESFSRKDRKLILSYLEKLEFEKHLTVKDKTEIYTESIYKRPIKNVIDYNKVSNNINESSEETQKYTYAKKEGQGLVVRSQILKHF